MRLFMKLLPALILAVIICGCAKETDFNTSVFDVADTLYSNIEFLDSMSEINPSMVNKLYPFDKDNLIEQKSYFSTGATAEEIAVFKFKKLTDKEMDIAKARIESQIASYKSYLPKEVEKLDNAVIIEKGNTLIICVCDDYKKATDLINKMK